MKKPNKKEHLNLLLSAFLILAFIVCANFFAGFTSSMPTMTAQLINIAVYAVFGLLLFYATRVGDGKAVFRFSPLTLLILVLPSVFIIVASLAAFMPLHNVTTKKKPLSRAAFRLTLPTAILPLPRKPKRQACRTSMLTENN